MNVLKVALAAFIVVGASAKKQTLNRSLGDLSCEPAPIAAKVKVKSTTGSPLQMREVRVFSSDINVAIGKNATQSSDLSSFGTASKAVDGRWGTYFSTEAGCTWWEVELEETFPIEKIILVNRKCPDDPACACQLSYASVSLLDGSGDWVAAKINGDTCDKGWIVHKFVKNQCPYTDPSDSPSASPTRSPTTTSPTNSPSLSPSASPSSSPTASPLKSPSLSPSVSPSTSPSTSPTASQSNLPSLNPSVSPSTSPSSSPTASASNLPSLSQSVFLSTSPSLSPTASASNLPSLSPSDSPSASPTTSPTASPMNSPSLSPSMTPSSSPSTFPTASFESPLQYLTSFSFSVHHDSKCAYPDEFDDLYQADCELNSSQSLV
eukprot:scaffold12816_cov65-Cyclotella_meneghiniana.AAC.3